MNKCTNIDSKNSGHYVKLESLKSMAMSEVKHLYSGSKEDDKNETKQNDDKYLDCYLYGAKYYRVKDTNADMADIVFDVCEQTAVTSSHDNSKTITASIGKVENVTSSVASTSTAQSRSGNAKEKNELLKKSILQNMEHEVRFTPLQLEKQQRSDNDDTCFYITLHKNQANHCFLVEKKKKLSVVKNWDHLDWHKRRKSKSKQKWYKLVPCFIVLVQFLFENVDIRWKNTSKYYNYMSLMESIDCLLTFKNYHKNMNTSKKGNDDGFEKCNQVLKKKLSRIAVKNGDAKKWFEVSCVFAFTFF